MLRRVRTRYISSSSAAKIKGNERAASSTPIEMLVVKTAWLLSNSFTPHLVSRMRRMRTMAIEMLVVKTAWILSNSFFHPFILEDRATHCSRHPQLSTLFL